MFLNANNNKHTSTTMFILSDCSYHFSFSKRRERKENWKLFKKTAGTNQVHRRRMLPYSVAVSQLVFPSPAEQTAQLCFQQQCSQKKNSPCFCTPLLPNLSNFPLFLVLCPVSLPAITQPDELLNNSRHLVRHPSRSRGTLRAWWRQCRKTERASVATAVCVRQDCPGSFTSGLCNVPLFLPQSK